MNLSDPLRELLGFIGQYLSLGVIGLRYGVLGRALGRPDADAPRTTILTIASRRAAGVGLVGMLLATGLLAAGIARVMAERHLALATILTAGQGETGVRLVLAALAIVGFLLALARVPAGWPLAGFATVAAALVNILSLHWQTLVNPVHVLAGSLWIGTLFVLMTIAVPAVLGSDQTHEDKALTIADLINAFSPLALISVAVLVLSGVVTAVRHLKFVAALWTTSYGITLVVKLCVVAIVLALGAWNWRRVRPSLGTHAASAKIQRSARLELAFAGLVLLITSVLVSLPSPRLPK